MGRGRGKRPTGARGELSSQTGRGGAEGGRRVHPHMGAVTLARARGRECSGGEPRGWEGNKRAGQRGRGRTVRGSGRREGRSHTHRRGRAVSGDEAVTGARTPRGRGKAGTERSRRAAQQGHAVYNPVRVWD